VTHGTTVAPPLKWAGGKRWQLRYLRPLWKPHAERRLVEPFCGGMSVALGLMPQRALLNDINPHLINFYAWVKRGLRVSIPLAHDPDIYYAHRARFNALLERGRERSREAAALFYYLNRTGYNGLYRVNSKNGFNVPFGDYKKPMICDADNLRACAGALQGATIENTSFTAVEERAERGDFVYFDPPYIPLTATSRFTDYTSEGFSDADQVRLRDVARSLKSRGVTVLLSNSSAQRVYDLYEKHFELRKVDARRSVNCDPNGRGRISELLIY